MNKRLDNLRQIAASHLVSLGLSRDTSREIVALLPAPIAATIIEEGTDLDAGEPICWVCGCSQERACAAGCEWAEDPNDPSRDICSRCVERVGNG